MSIKRASAAVAAAGLVIGLASPLAAAPGDYAGTVPAPPDVPAAGTEYVGTSPPATPVVIPVGLPPAGSDYAGIGSDYAGIALDHTRIASGHLRSGTQSAQPAAEVEGGVRRASPASSSSLPVTSGDLAGLTGMGLLALGVFGSLRRRTS